MSQKRALILIAPHYQDEEVTEPVAFLEEQGVEVVFGGLEKGVVGGKNGRASVQVMALLDEISSEDFDLLLIPGGGAPEILRLESRVLELTRSFFELPGRVVAAICHGPQVLISAQVLPGRTLTCYAGIRDDVKLAGARYVDKPVHVDGRLITSRTPADLPAFNEALGAALFPEEAQVAEAIETAGTPETPAPAEAPEAVADPGESDPPLDVESS